MIMQTIYHQSSGSEIDQSEMPYHSLRQQVKRIVEDKIKRICGKEFDKANKLPNGQYKKRHVPYTLPACISKMTAFLSELADQNTNRARIEEIAGIVTTGQIMQEAY